MKKLFAVLLSAAICGSAVFANGLSLGGLDGGLGVGGTDDSSANSASDEDRTKFIIGAKFSGGFKTDEDPGIGGTIFCLVPIKSFSVQGEVGLLWNDAHDDAEHQWTCFDAAILGGVLLGSKKIIVNPYIGLKYGYCSGENGDEDYYYDGYYSYTGTQTSIDSFAALLGCQVFLGPVVAEGRYAIECVSPDDRSNTFYLNIGLAFKF